MSYDLIVFNPKAAPKSEPEFMKWCDQQTEWKEDHSYNDPKVTSTELQNWFMEMIEEFPALNGPHSPTNIDDIIDHEEKANYVTDYCIGKDIIQSGFRWPIAKKAHAKTMELAQKHSIGFYNVSGDGKIYMPDEYGNYREIKEHNKKIFSYGGASNYKQLTASSWEDISKIIAKIDGKNISFLILENEIGDYMQCLGNANKLTIEYRYKAENNYKHIVLGKTPAIEKKVKIKTSTGDVTINENEVFDFNELKEIIKEFYHSNKIEGEYSYRNL